MRRTNSPTASTSPAPTDISARSIPRWSASLLSWRDSPPLSTTKKAERDYPAPPFLLREAPGREAAIAAREIKTEPVAGGIAEPGFAPQPAFVFGAAVDMAG